MQVKKQQLEPDVEQWTGSKLGTSTPGLYIATWLFNFYAEYNMWNDGLDEAQAGIKIAGININNLIYADDTTLMTESEEELKSLLMVLKEIEKPGLKLKIQKTKIMAFSPITSWQIDGETMKTVRDFIFLGFKISVDGDCSHEIKRCLPLGRKVMTNLDSILKSRDITLLTKVHLVKGLVFPVVMLWELDYKESWVLKNWWFWTVVLYKAVESPLDCKEIQPVHRKENQSWIFIVRTNDEADTPIFWPPYVKNGLIGKYPDAGKDWMQEEKGVDRGWDGWMASLTWRTWVEQALALGQGSLVCCSPYLKELDTAEWVNRTELRQLWKTIYSWKIKIMNNKNGAQIITMSGVNSFSVGLLLISNKPHYFSSEIFTYYNL